MLGGSNELIRREGRKRVQCISDLTCQEIRTTWRTGWKLGEAVLRGSLPAVRFVAFEGSVWACAGKRIWSRSAGLFRSGVGTIDYHRRLSKFR